MDKITLFVGIFALSLFSYAQFQGWNMLDNTATSGTSTSGSHGSGSRTYHK